MSASEAVAHSTGLASVSGDVSAASEQAPILPTHSRINRSLVAVIAIMTFLASLALGGVVLVRTAALEWQGQISRELTVQVRVAPGRNVEADVARAVDLVRAMPGVAQVRAFSANESARLLEPWLGAGLVLDALPVPRMIVVTASAGAGPDVAQMRRVLREAVATATVDDHRGWIERMRDMTRAATMGGVGVLGLTLLATVLLVFSATEGAMASNRHIVEVLHFVGARNRFIAGEFQRQFLLLGLRGAVFGACAASAMFLAVRGITWFLGPVEQTGLLAVLTLRIDGYAGIAGLTLLLAAVAAITSRATVHRILNSLE
ncbi:MAG: cell division transport system permease protein [Variibacter sp.]|nr:cell division transport system permease protein [Variibacter sp.]